MTLLNTQQRSGHFASESVKAPSVESWPRPHSAPVMAWGDNGPFCGFVRPRNGVDGLGSEWHSPAGPAKISDSNINVFCGTA